MCRTVASRLGGSFVLLVLFVAEALGARTGGSDESSVSQFTDAVKHPRLSGDESAKDRGRVADELRGFALDSERVPVCSLQPFDVALEKPTGPARNQIGIRRSLPCLADQWQWVVERGDTHSVARRIVQSPGARSLRLHFTDFELPAGVVVIVASSSTDGPMRGPFSARGPFGSGDFLVPSTGGDRATIYVRFPNELRLADAVRFRVADVVHRYAELPRVPGNGLAVAPNARCSYGLPIPADWADVAKSVGALIRVDDTGDESFCTGTLLATENGDFTPYFLTAKHCDVDSQPTSVEVWWGFDSAGIHTAETYGARLVSASEASDYALLMLLGTIPRDLVWSGWQTTMPSSFTAVAGIHHPNEDGDMSGAFKRFSTGDVALQQTPECQGPAASSHLKVDWDTGGAGTEKGSSGSAIFLDSPTNKRLVGQLHGVCSDSCTTDSYYGRLDVSYAHMGSVMSPHPLSAGPDDAFEPSDSRSTARRVATNGWSDSLVVKSVDEDWYSADVPAGGRLVVSLSFVHDLGDVDVVLYRGSATTAVAADTSDGDGVELEVFNDGMAATYTWRVYLADDTRADYGMLTLVTSDTFNPEVSIASPTGSATHSTPASPIIIGGVASDNYFLKSVTCTNVRTGTVVNAAGLQNWSCSVALAGGDNLINVIATDAAGRTASDSLTISFSPSQAARPAVSTSSATNVSVSGATLGGHVTTDGGAAITERGVVYARSAVNPNPAIGGSGVIKLATAGTTGAFAIAASGLSAGTSYATRAYAINSVGTAYGEAATFSTPTQPSAPSIVNPTATNVSATGAMLGGNVVFDGGAAITERGVVYARSSANETPVIGDPGVIRRTTTGTTGVFAVSVDGLSGNTSYAFRPYAINAAGIAYGSVSSFVTGPQGSIPSVTTPTATSIGPDEATLGGTVVSDGSGGIAERGVVYSIQAVNGTPSINGSGAVRVPTAGTLGGFTISVTGLASNTTYSYRAYAVNGNGVAYSNVASFRTTDNTILLYETFDTEVPANWTFTDSDAPGLYTPPYGDSPQLRATARYDTPAFTIDLPGNFGRQAGLRIDFDVTFWSDNHSQQVTLDYGSYRFTATGGGYSCSALQRLDYPGGTKFRSLPGNGGGHVTIILEPEGAISFYFRDELIGSVVDTSVMSSAIRITARDCYSYNNSFLFDNFRITTFTPVVAGASYRFDEGSGVTASDSSGNGFHGAAEGAAWVPSPTGTALRFGAGPSRVLLPPSLFASFVGSNTAYFEAWIRPTAFARCPSDEKTTVFRKRGETNEWSVELDCLGQVHTTLTGASMTDAVRTIAGAAPLAVWTKIAAWYDGATMHIYNNGSEILTYTRPTVIDWVGNYIRAEIGGSAHDDRTGAVFHGDIDGVIISIQKPATISMTGPLAVPGGLAVTRLPSGSPSPGIEIVWDHVEGADGYDLEINGSIQHVTGRGVFAAAEPTAWVVRVRATRSGIAPSNWSTREIAVGMAFSDDPLVVRQTVIRATHLNEIRSAVNLVRAAAGLPGISFTGALVPGAIVRSSHVSEIRDAVSQTLAALGMSQVASPRPAPGMAVTAAQIQQLRDALR